MLLVVHASFASTQPPRSAFRLILMIDVRGTIMTSQAHSDRVAEAEVGIYSRSQFVLLVF
jgi:hypothetical protein